MRWDFLGPPHGTHPFVHFGASYYICIFYKGLFSGELSAEVVAREEISLCFTQTCPCNIQQYFTAVKNVNFQMKFFNIFLIFAHNIDCGYTLEPPE